MASSPSLNPDAGFNDFGYVTSEDAEEVEPTVLFPERKTKLERASNKKTYATMIEAAIFHLSERNGSSRQAIVKYVMANNEVSDKAGRWTKIALLKLVEEQRVFRVSGNGANGRFKLAPAVKEATKKGNKPKLIKPKTKSTGKASSDAAGKAAKTTKNKSEGDDESRKKNKKNTKGKSKSKEENNEVTKGGKEAKKAGTAARKKSVVSSKAAAKKQNPRTPKKMGDSKTKVKSGAKPTKAKGGKSSRGVAKSAAEKDEVSAPPSTKATKDGKKTKGTGKNTAKKGDGKTATRATRQK